VVPVEERATFKVSLGFFEVEVFAGVELTPAALVVNLLAVRVAIFNDRLGELDGEIGVICPGPAVGDAVACDMGGILNLHLGPEGFSVVVVNAMDKIKDNMTV